MFALQSHQILGHLLISGLLKTMASLVLLEMVWQCSESQNHKEKDMNESAFALETYWLWDPEQVIWQVSNPAEA